MTDVVTTPRYSGFWRRLLGLIIDAIIIGVITGVLRVILGAVNIQGNAALFVPQIVVALVYFTWGWGSGQTVGCMVLNMRMIDQSTGAAPGYVKGLIRFIIVEILGLTVILGLIGNLWMLWDAKKQTWQDKVAGTLVVDA
jgi:uncharacterized RDD family membrane protein YckC